MRADLINDLREVADNIYRGETDGWDEDMVREAIRALEEVQPRCLHARNVLENGVYRCKDCGFEQPSSAPETVKPFGTGPLCEEDPDPAREGYCAYHDCFH